MDNQTNQDFVLTGGSVQSLAPTPDQMFLLGDDVTTLGSDSPMWSSDGENPAYGTNGGLSPAGLTYSLEPAGASGINAPVNAMTMPAASPGSTPDGWDFLNQLATTSMTTAGAILGQKLQQEVNAGQQALQNKLGVNQPPPKPATPSSGGTVLIVGILLVGGVMAMSGKRRN